MRWYFGFFLVSGFCSILYELVWLRLAMAQFSVTTALVSIVLSVFMIGLGLGSLAAGRRTRNRTAQSISALRLYALCELLIAVSAILVPLELSWGRALLEKLTAASSLSLPAYYVAAAIWIAFTLVPWCACMGATLPLGMAAIREKFSEESTRSFSYLYLANLFGAVLGSVLPLLFIEAWGFRATLRLAGVLNASLAVTAFLLFRDSRPSGTRTIIGNTFAGASSIPSSSTTSFWAHCLLFATGFTSMGVEVVWVRLFSPVLGTFVYAFASILCLYLEGNYFGSRFYRKRQSREEIPGSIWLALFGCAVLLPLLTRDPRLPALYSVAVLSVLPFSFIAGFITPMVLDHVSLGDPDRAGRGYAINLAGCVLGPLVTGFLLLPFLGERYTLLILALPWMAASFLGTRVSLSADMKPHSSMWHKPAIVALVSLVLVLETKDFESQFLPREVRRDSTATVIAMGITRDQKGLLVNGVGMTGLTPITKMIAHLPLAFMPRPPRNALIVCFGMGTSHRSALSWGIPSTAVELVPSVPAVFPYFHADGTHLLHSPLSHVVVDDGRFYLERSTEQFDVIAIDPPPPVEAAGSSLLYSKEFYAIARQHLRPDGILQQWYPGDEGDPTILSSIAKALKESFPYVRVFQSIGGWGYHFLASASPIPTVSAAVLASRLPAAAITDLLEWGPALNGEEQFARVLKREMLLDSLIQQVPATPPLQDDRPVNEYFLLRRIRDRAYEKLLWKSFRHKLGLARSAN